MNFHIPLAQKMATKHNRYIYHLLRSSLTKISVYVCCIVLLQAFISCDGMENMEDFLPKSTFDSPFPKANRDLTHILGSQLHLKRGEDTLSLRITTSQRLNVITNAQTNDTLFYGTVSKFRGLYYFSQQLTDTSYWIYAIKITDQLIYGLHMGWEQMYLVDEAIEAGNHKKLVTYIDTSQHKIRLHPYKKEVRDLFTAIMDSIAPDTILSLPTKQPMLAQTKTISEQIDPEEYAFVSKAFPNPTKDFVHIELQEENGIRYLLTDLSGKTILKGKFDNHLNKLDLRNQVNGVYVLTLLSPNTKQGETLKIIKTQ